jgi:hypothetical protein
MAVLIEQHFSPGSQHAAPKPVDGLEEQNVVPNLPHRVECGTLIPALGATDALVLVRLDDRPATMFRHRARTSR